MAGNAAARGRVQPQHLVVLIPGIGGSELADDRGRTVWGGSLGRFALNALFPSVLSVDESPSLRPIGLLSAARSLPGLTSLHPYEDLLKRIERDFDCRVDRGHPDRRDLDADVVAFPYDFRRSIVEAAEHLDREVRERVEHRGSLEGGGPPVVVVAHSMGGLVARYWLGPLGGGELCERLITLGTPHRGAPKALDWLVNGVRVKGVRHRAATEVIRSWPAAFELLPRYEVVVMSGLDAEGDGRATDGGSEAVDPDPADRGHERRYPHKAGIAVLGAPASDAFAVHEAIESVWGDAPGESLPRVLAYFGHGHATPSSASWDGTRLAVSDAPFVVGDAEWFGDATVPQVSAVPIEMSDGADQRDLWRPVPKRHGALGSAGEVIEELRKLWGDPLGGVRGVAERGVSIGVRIDDTITEGDGLDLGAVLRNAPVGEADEGAVRDTPVRDEDNEPGARAVVRPHGRARLEQVVRLDADGEGWTGSIPGLEPGVHRVEIEVTGVPGGDPDPVTEWVTVVEGP